MGEPLAFSKPIEYTKRPGILRTDFSWEQSNGIMNSVVSAVHGIYIETEVRHVPSTFESRRYEQTLVTGSYFELALEYVAPDGKEKAKVIVRFKPKGNPDSKFRRLDEVVSAAMK